MTVKWPTGSKRRSLTGSADRILEQVAELERSGVTHAQVRIPSQSSAELVEQVERFGREVVAAT